MGAARRREISGDEPVVGGTLLHLLERQRLAGELRHGDVTLYRQGRHHLIMQTPDNFAAAKRCFEQAIARDPRFALAYDALADLWWYFDFMGFAPPKTVAGIGMSYALRALEIDNTLAAGRADRGGARRAGEVARSR
jgi:hypothetical protein